MSLNQKLLKITTFAMFIAGVIGFASCIHGFIAGGSKLVVLGIAVMSVWALYSTRFGIAGANTPKKCEDINYIYYIHAGLTLTWIALTGLSVVVDISHGAHVSLMLALLYLVLDVISLVFISKVVKQVAL